jgi:hypothetical protein
VGALLTIVAVLGLIMATFGIIGYAVMDDVEDWFPSDGESHATITGQATYPNGDGIEGVLIHVQGESRMTTTDDDGYYILYNVPSGDQVFVASKENFTTLELKVTVNDYMSSHGPRFDGDRAWDWDIDFVMQEGTGVETIGSWDETDMMFEKGSVWLLVCTVVVLVASLLALLGALNAFKRRNLMIVIVGAVAGIFSFGFFIGSVLAFVALFILLLGMDEFRSSGDAEPA